MERSIQCPVHGKSEPTFVCVHLLGDPVGLGFHCDQPSEEAPFPVAWCNDCELIRAAHGGWTEESEKIAQISLLCARCYERARIRNTHTSTTLDDLANLRWKCGRCEEWHSGPCLDFAYDSPIHWTAEHVEASGRKSLLRNWGRKRKETFLREDYCVIEDEHFFVRGVITLPIVGTDQTFTWGVWGSLSRGNFAKVSKMDGKPERANLPPMFSWLGNKIPEYPDTLNMKMYLHIQQPGWRPLFELEPTDHPLSQEYHKGIRPERVKEIMAGRFRTSRLK